MQPATHDFSGPLVTSCHILNLLSTLKEIAISGKHNNNSNNNNNNNNNSFISTKRLDTRMHLISSTGASIPGC